MHDILNSKSKTAFILENLWKQSFIMKQFYKFYSKIRMHRRSDIQSIVHSEIHSEMIQQTIKQKAINSTENMLNDEPRNEKVIVTLTSFAQRLQSVFLVIESIAQQTMKPDEVVLWLSEDDFDDKKLPITLKKLINRGLKVVYCKDVGPHTKLIYAARQYPDDILITIDDDIIYPMDLIENLYRMYLENPKSICCNAAKLISFDSNNKILPYLKWETKNTQSKQTRNLLILGVNGVLYFPRCFDNEVFNVSAFSQLCPKADDIWFRMMALKNNIDISITGSYPDLSYYFIPLDTSFINALSVSNDLGGGNDRQLKSVIEHFNLSFD